MTEPPHLPARRGDYRVITCVMPAGRGAEVLEILRREQGVVSASLHHARGIGTQSLRRHRAYSDEKQIITALVTAERGDAVFESIYFAAGIDAPHAGMVMMGHAFRAAGLESPPAAEGMQQLAAGCAAAKGVLT